MRAANGEENSRSTLITGIPASIASIATSVRAAPSVGSSTIASTSLLMNVSTCAICWLASLVPSAVSSSMSSYCSAASRALLLIAASQPWSAAGTGEADGDGVAGVIVGAHGVGVAVAVVG